MTKDFRELLAEHLKNVSTFTAAKTLGERYEAKKKMDDSQSRIALFPNATPDDIKALDEVTRYRETK